MRVVLLSGASSIHTIRWANGLNSKGIDVHLITQHEPLEQLDEGVKVYQFPYRGLWGYFTMVPATRKLLKKIAPDIVNVHYASGYATTARLVNYHPWVLSVWGSDVFDFPNQSFVHRYWVSSNIKSADSVASTSLCMAEQTRRIVPSLSNITITPFGVDTTRFLMLNQSIKDELVVGTVKVIDYKYGIDTLINAFALLKHKLMGENNPVADRLRLRIVGDGPQINKMKALASSLSLEDSVDFIGRVPHNKVAEELSNFDIFVALSRLDSESFGVSVIEASAAGLPVVVSDAGGLPEVVIKSKTGIVVPRNNPSEAATAIYELIINEQKRLNMGLEGRKHVSRHYDWDNCLNKMIALYMAVISESRGE